MDEQTRIIRAIDFVINETKPAECIKRKEIIERVKRRIPDGDAISDSDIMRELRKYKKMRQGEV